MIGQTHYQLAIIQEKSFIIHLTKRIQQQSRNDDDDDDGDDGYDDDDDDYVRLTGKLFHSLSHLMYPLPSGLNLQVIKKTFPYACTFYNIYCSSLSTRLQTNCLLMQNKTQTPLK